MQVKPRIRGFICTTAHPTGCAQNVRQQVDYVRDQGVLDGAKNALVIGCSSGYGLASRITAAFGCGAGTLGVSFERAPADNRTATAGWYNNAGFDDLAQAHGLYAKTIDGDAFSDEIKDQVVAAIKADMGTIDLLVYSLASPVRQHPKTGELYRSALKPLGETFDSRTLNVDLNKGTGAVVDVSLEPADEAETAATIAVMGGEDWEFWIDALAEANVLAPTFKTVAYTYIGNELTWPIYWDGTLGKAKEDLDRASRAITHNLSNQGIEGTAHVAVLKAVVTQASTAIPVVPLYFSILFRIMKERGTHEDCIEHIDRLFREQLYAKADMRLDEVGRIRMDNFELDEEVQAIVSERWEAITSENVAELADLEGFTADFMRVFGFGLDGVDYDADVDPTLGRTE